MSSPSKEYTQKTALITVYDKSGVVNFAKRLDTLGYRILSTGGTARLLLEHAIPLTVVEDYTEGKEMFSGRVKTLHPKIFGGLLFDRKNKDHLAQKEEFSVSSIDLVVVNFYPFCEKVVSQNLNLEEYEN